MKLDISKFIYIQKINREIDSLKLEYRNKKKENKEYIHLKMIYAEAHRRVSNKIKEMDSGPWKDLLKLEREYIRKLEKQKLNQLIINHYGGLKGEYSLQEIAELFNVTRESIRQTEVNALKIFKIPQNARITRIYINDLFEINHGKDGGSTNDY